QEAAEKVMQENANVVYAMRRLAAHNHIFYLYGSWSSENAWCVMVDISAGVATCGLDVHGWFCACVGLLPAGAW
ncbi:MAG: hypothetical protein O7C59_02775, partial [Rickettsia endosymbiont of Ixodes persulcatus]|nr:hypothetical protein [Rickettsia endosymbiont of Ixodes persulcatus]